MVTVQSWSGREARLLRAAMRMSIRDFAAHLGVSDRVISKWEAGGENYCPRPDSQAMLDTALGRATDEIRIRFAEALGGQPETTAPGDGRIGVDSHKFLPVFIGATQAQRLQAEMGTGSGRWLASSSAKVDHPDADTTCTLHVFGCGVAVFHLRQPKTPASLTELAVWRYRSYATDLPWAGTKTRELLGAAPGQQIDPEYILSLYWVTSSPWAAGRELDTALRLLSTPSVLVDRGVPSGADALHPSVEESLLANGFDHPDIVSFGIRGVSTGYAGWSGVAYRAHSSERSLTVDELITCELTVQALWCFSRQIQKRVEDGQDPSTSEEFGWRFLRAALSRLTTARAQETAQHVLMREAIMKTSGLAERLRAAQEALRDSMT
ncbi:multiprotein-bridging factor 1 family protein [Streptomyces sp. NPDC020917]|uniref:multiprotein-bridging factor 1 family protein n=1 Tax=Streptomyces sp. NPDC020917 TaxID=3365102 RepID=UPI0037895787